MPPQVTYELFSQNRLSLSAGTRTQTLLKNQRSGLGYLWVDLASGRCHRDQVNQHLLVLASVVLAASSCQLIQLASRGGEGGERVAFMTLSPPFLMAQAPALSPALRPGFGLGKTRMGPIRVRNGEFCPLLCMPAHN